MVDYGFLDDEQLEESTPFFLEENIPVAKEKEASGGEYEPTLYTIQNNSAKYIHMIQISALYLHAKYTEPISDMFPPLRDQEQRFITAPVFDLEEK